MAAPGCDGARQAGEALIHALSAFILKFLCSARNGKGNSELFKESHDEAVHKNFYESRLCE